MKQRESFSLKNDIFHFEFIDEIKKYHFDSARAGEKSQKRRYKSYEGKKKP